MREDEFVRAEKADRVRDADGGRFPIATAECALGLAYDSSGRRLEICANSPHRQSEPSGDWDIIPNRTDLLVEESRAFVSSPDLNDYVFDAGAHHFYQWSVVFDSGTTRNAWVQTTAINALAASRSNPNYAVRFLGEQDDNDAATALVHTLASNTDYFYVHFDAIRRLDRSSYVAPDSIVDHWEWREVSTVETAGPVSGNGSPDNPVTIRDGAIDRDALATNSVHTEEIAEDAVTGFELSNNAVNSPHLVDGAVTLTKHANNSVATNHYVDDSITAAKLDPTIRAQLGAGAADKLDRDFSNPDTSPFTVGDIPHVNGSGGLLWEGQHYLTPPVFTIPTVFQGDVVFLEHDEYGAGAREDISLTTAPTSDGNNVGWSIRPGRAQIGTLVSGSPGALLAVIGYFGDVTDARYDSYVATTREFFADVTDIVLNDTDYPIAGHVTQYQDGGNWSLVLQSGIPHVTTANITVNFKLTDGTYRFRVSTLTNRAGFYRWDTASTAYERLGGGDGVVTETGTTCSGNDLVLARTGGLSSVTVQDACVGSGGGAGEANVQVDWTETDLGSDAYILNKATTITLVQTNKLAAIEANAEVNERSNWNETTTSDDAFILNKPSIPNLGAVTGDILPNTDNSHGVGSSSHTFRFGHFTEITVDTTLNIPADSVDHDALADDAVQVENVDPESATDGTVMTARNGAVAFEAPTNILRVEDSGGLYDETGIDHLICSGGGIECTGTGNTATINVSSGGFRVAGVSGQLNHGDLENTDRFVVADLSTPNNDNAYVEWQDVLPNANEGTGVVSEGVHTFAFNADHFDLEDTNGELAISIDPSFSGGGGGGGGGGAFSGALVGRTNDQSTNGNAGSVLWQSEIYDEGDWWVAGSLTSGQFTVPAGVSHVVVTCYLEVNSLSSGSQAVAQIRMGGALIDGGGRASALVASPVTTAYLTATSGVIEVDDDDTFQCYKQSSDSTIGIDANSWFAIRAVQGGGSGTAANDDALNINNPQGESTDEAPTRRSTAAAINAERSHPIVLEYAVNQAVTDRDTQSTRLIGNIYQAEFDFRVQGFRLRADVPPNSVRTWTARIFKVAQVAADDYQRGTDNPIVTPPSRGDSSDPFTATVRIDSGTSGIITDLEAQIADDGFAVAEDDYFFVGFSQTTQAQTYLVGDAGAVEDSHVGPETFPHSTITYIAKAASTEAEPGETTNIFHNTTNALRTEIDYDAVTSIMTVREEGAVIYTGPVEIDCIGSAITCEEDTTDEGLDITVSLTDIDGNVLPNADDAHSLGTSARTWGSAHISDLVIDDEFRRGGAEQLRLVCSTQADYDALTTPHASTVYVIAATCP